MPVPSAREFFFPTRPLDAAAQQAREHSFFHALRLPNGTCKLTYPDRMPDMDAAVCAQLAPGQSVRVLDVGVSSGVTTLELLQALDAHGVRSETVAVDILVNAFLVRRLGMDLLVDVNGAVLQMASPLFVRGRPHDTALPRRAALMRFIRWVEGRVGGAAGAHAGQPVQLITPRLLERGDVRVVEHDLTQPNRAWEGRFDVVRAANVLNHDYFPPETLRTMLAHLRTYLRPGGLLVLVRTLADRSNHGTILRRLPDGQLEPVSRIGDGSEVESIATGLSVPALTAC